MNCAYILQNEIHEKYLLGRLTENEKQAYKKHLQNCPSCSEALENERLLIAGVQAAAKQNMKDEIQAQVAQLRSERVKVDWALMYKAAAVLLVLVMLPGLSWYYLHIESPLEAVHKTVIFSAEDDPAPVMAELDEEAAEQEISQVEKIEGQKESGKDSRPVKREKTQKRSKKHAVAEIDVPDRQAVQPVPTIPVSAAKNEMDQISGLGLASGKAAQSIIAKQAAKGESLVSDMAESIIEYRYIPTLDRELMVSKKAARASSQKNTWKFASEQGRIIINYAFEKSDTNYINYKILNRRENQLELSWVIFYEHRELHPQSLRLKLANNHILQVYQQDSLLYRLDLQKGSGRADKLE